MRTRSLALLCLILLLAAACVATAGQTISIVQNRTPVMDGSKTMAYLAKGMRLPVEKVNGDWFGVRVKVGGEVVFGWVHKKYTGTGSGAPTSLAERAKAEFEKRKAKAESLMGEGKFDEAMAVLDSYPSHYWKTKWANEIRRFGLELEERAKGKPEVVEKSAEKEFNKRKAKAERLFKEGKVQDAIQHMASFPGRFEKTKWAGEAEKYRLDLARRAHAPFETLYKEVFALLEAGKFDEASQAVAAAKDKLPGGGTQVADIGTFIDLHKKAAAGSKPAPGRFATDVYHSDQEYRAHLFSPPTSTTPTRSTAPTCSASPTSSSRPAAASTTFARATGSPPAASPSPSSRWPSGRSCSTGTRSRPTSGWRWAASTAAPSSPSAPSPCTRRPAASTWGIASCPWRPASSRAASSP